MLKVNLDNLQKKKEKKERKKGVNGTVTVFHVWWLYMYSTLYAWLILCVLN